MDVNQTQQLFFNHIKSKLPLHLSFVDEVAELLNISNDSAYRRIRGEKPIGLDEVQILCNKYKVSLDQLLQIQSDTVIFSGNKVDNVSYSFKQYLQEVIGDNLQLFKILKNPHVYYFNKDIPIFHYMQFPELMAFKFFFWKRSLLGYPEMARQQFTGGETDEETVAAAKRITDLYIQIPSTEIWNEENVHCTIRQIEYYRQSNIFADNAMVLKVYSQLEDLLNHIESQAEAGKKFLVNNSPNTNGASYNVYINECILGNNTIFVQSDERNITFLNHNGLNALATQDKLFCDYTVKNLQNIITKSTQVSIAGEKERSMFFYYLRSKIYEKKKAII